ncbi:MAG: ribosome silencing factor [Paracraurococcus sp.]
MRAKPKAVAKPKPVAEPTTDRKRQAVAGPDAAPKRPRKPKIAPDRLEQIVAAARTSLEDDKAEEILVLDVTGRSDFTDRMIIATGQVERQLQAMAVHLEDALEKVGMKLRRSDIQASPDWVLIDAGDLVIHLFRPEARVTYALERMWGPESPAPEA